MNMKTHKIKIGIVGGAGYTGGELIRILLHHPNAVIIFVQSRSKAGDFISSVHNDLFGDTELKFDAEISQNIDVVFLCLGHGDSKEMVAAFDASIKIIDLSQDFRLKGSTDFVYGLPELNSSQIKNANFIANPGCFATAIQLAILPLAKEKIMQSDIHVACTTGSTGAGQSLHENSHFSWRQNNLSTYKSFTHQHLAEINQSLLELQPDFLHKVIMVPQRGAFTRGIFACVTLEIAIPLKEVQALFTTYYEHHPFVFMSTTNIDLKQVVNTNKCILYLEKHGNQLMIVSVIDNLLKGASGQAVQNMNLLFGLEESTGLKLKASAF